MKRKKNHNELGILYFYLCMSFHALCMFVVVHVRVAITIYLLSYC